MERKVFEKEKLAKEYSDLDTASLYIDKRFEAPIGRILHEHQVKFINNFIKDHDIKNILEIACGPARLTSEVEGFKQGIAIDFNESMLSVAKKRLNILNKLDKWQLYQADAFNLDLNKKFDLIYSFRFIRHFMKDDRIRLYNIIKKHLVTGGYLIFDVVNEQVSYPHRLKAGIDKFKIYDKLFKRQEFIDEMEENGFLVEKLEPTQVHYDLLYKLQIYISPRSYSLAYRLMNFIEYNLKANPMEWIALCRLK